MLHNRFFISLVSTVFLYVALGFSLFYLFQNHTITDQTPQEKILSFSLSEYVPQESTPVEEIIKEEIVEPVEEPESVPEEVKEEPKIEEKLPEPIVEKVVPQPIPIVKKVVKKVVKKKPVVQKKKATKSKTKTRVAKNTSTKKLSSPSKIDPAKKNRFFNQLRIKIDKYKTYPRVAQKRGMQGTVKIRFTILPNGQVGNIKLSGSNVFHTSARDAIQKAFPINIKNAPISLPATVNLTLRYQIR